MWQGPVCRHCKQSFTNLSELREHAHSCTGTGTPGQQDYPPAGKVQLDAQVSAATPVGHTLSPYAVTITRGFTPDTPLTGAVPNLGHTLSAKQHLLSSLKTDVNVDWVCPGCTFRNTHNDTACRMCKEKRHHRSCAWLFFFFFFFFFYEGFL